MCGTYVCGPLSGGTARSGITVEGRLRAVLGSTLVATVPYDLPLFWACFWIYFLAFMIA